MLLHEKCKTSIGQGNRNITERLLKTARGFEKRVYSRLSREQIRKIRRGQSPGELVISPPAGLVKLGIAPPVGLDTPPGKKFTVTCTEDGKLDGFARDSVSYGAEHLEIREVSLHLGGEHRAALEREMEAFGRHNISITWNCYNVDGGRIILLKEREGKRLSEEQVGKVPERPVLIDAVVIDCGDSRVMTYSIFRGHNIAVVSNAGNALSPTALSTIRKSAEEGVPASLVLGHGLEEEKRGCGAIAGLIGGNAEKELAATMGFLDANVPERGSMGQGEVEMASALASCRILEGIWSNSTVDSAEAAAAAGLIAGKEMFVVPLYLNMGTGGIMELSSLITKKS